MDCRRCSSFRFHDTYEYLGTCIQKNELIVLTPDMKTCENYKEFTLEELKKILMEKGWLRCVSCNKTICAVEELEKHALDMLVPDIYSDVVASEEAPAAD